MLHSPSLQARSHLISFSSAGARKLERSCLWSDDGSWFLGAGRGLGGGEVSGRAVGAVEVVLDAESVLLRRSGHEKGSSEVDGTCTTDARVDHQFSVVLGGGAHAAEGGAAAGAAAVGAGAGAALVPAAIPAAPCGPMLPHCFGHAFHRPRKCVHVVALRPAGVLQKHQHNNESVLTMSKALLKHLCAPEGLPMCTRLCTQASWRPGQAPAERV
eukprot:1159938-Pelagomonas_calceolata.AAC.6